jgi:hypothetical protein
VFVTQIYFLARLEFAARLIDCSRLYGQALALP